MSTLAGMTLEAKDAGEVVMPRVAVYLALICGAKNTTWCTKYVRATQCEPYVSIQAGVIAAYTIMVNI